MKKTTFFKSILLALVILVGSVNAWGQTLIAGWDFQTTTSGGTAAAAAPNSPKVYVANIGTGTLYLDGTNGSSTWITATTGNEVSAFGGTALNAGTGFSSTTTSPACLALVGGASPYTANGKFMVFKFSMTGKSNLIVSYATQKTTTGFSSQIWEYSTNGSTWTAAQTISTVPTSFAVTTLTTITGLDNASTAYLRLSLTGATATAGNNRLDNIQLNATTTSATPTISISPSTLTGFTYSGSGPSAEQTFTVGGTNLTNNISITAPTDYEISTGTGGSFVATSPITLTQTGGTVATTTIYARLKAGLAVSSYNSENIAVASTGATTQNVACSGSVTAITPTITVTELTVAAFSANIGSAPTKMINVSAANLTGNITLALSGTNADQFSLSQSSITQSGGTVPNTVITITYTPTTTGAHTATLTLSSAGATDVTRSLSGTAGLATPVAAESSANNNSGFTANWSAIPGATDYVLSVYTKTGGGALATDLFISEYVEGTSNNKAIEIFNGTGAPVDLSAYSLKKQTNGAGAYTTEQLLTGTLANNDVFVLANTSANATILGVADLTNNTTMTFNGNDAVALFKGVNQLDEVGIFNQVANWGIDQTLIRKSSITSPKATYDVADWDVQTTDYITNLGSHTMTGSSNVQVAGSPFTVTGTNSYSLTGLQGGSTYYYTVVAKNATVTTASSNEIIASTMATGLSTTQNSLSVSASDGIIRFTAESGQVMELYNAVGQKLLIKTTTAGLNSIPVAAKGFVVVKVGNQIAKVVL